VKSRIQGLLDKFLDDDSALAPVDSKKPKISEPPGPLAQFTPVVN
jgi:hypothetical protein